MKIVEQNKAGAI